MQARTVSSRLPDKVVKPLGGIPLLVHCIRRLTPVAPVIVATSALPQDDPVERLAQCEHVACFRGSENDVLDRYYQAALEFHLKFIVRATGDNPFVDPEEAIRVKECILHNPADYVTGFEVVDNIGLPVGVGVEAFTLEALKRSWQEAHADHHREHVNEYIFEQSNAFQVLRLKCLLRNNCPDLRLTVDTNDDFLFVQKILREIEKPAVAIRTPEIIEWWQQRNL